MEVGADELSDEGCQPPSHALPRGSVEQGRGERFDRGVQRRVAPDEPGDGDAVPRELSGGEQVEGAVRRAFEGADAIPYALAKGSICGGDESPRAVEKVAVGDEDEAL